MKQTFIKYISFIFLLSFFIIQCNSSSSSDSMNDPTPNVDPDDTKKPYPFTLSCEDS